VGNHSAYLVGARRAIHEADLDAVATSRAVKVAKLEGRAQHAPGPTDEESVMSKKFQFPRTSPPSPIGSTANGPSAMRS
jgi:hypothetical protein